MDVRDDSAGETTDEDGLSGEAARDKGEEEGREKVNSEGKDQGV